MRTLENKNSASTYFMGIRISHTLKYNDEEFVKRNTNEHNRIYAQIDRKQDVMKLHGESFSKYKGINKGKEVVIIGTGPSLANYQPIKGAINIGCNRAFQYDKIHLDYLFAADWYGVRPYIEEAKDYDCTKFYGTFLDTKNIEFLLMPEYILEQADHRYYCMLKPSEAYKDIDCYPLMNSGSIALSALNFALYTHPKKIYLVGLDTTVFGNFDKKKQSGAPMNVELVKKGYNQIKKMAYVNYPDVEIVAVNPVGLRGIFSDYYQDMQPLNLPMHHNFSDFTNTNISISGLSVLEKDDMRWSEKEEAKFEFVLKDKNNLIAEFNFVTSQRLLEQIGQFDVEVFANDFSVHKFTCTAEEEITNCTFKIRKRILRTGQNCIKFKFSQQYSPKMFKLNSDYRYLGLKFKDMTLKEVQ